MAFHISANVWQYSEMGRARIPPMPAFLKLRYGDSFGMHVILIFSLSRSSSPSTPARRRVRNRPRMVYEFHPIRFAWMWPVEAHRLDMAAAPDCPYNLKILGAEGQTIMVPVLALTQNGGPPSVAAGAPRQLRSQDAGSPAVAAQPGRGRPNGRHGWSPRLSAFSLPAAYSACGVGGGSEISRTCYMDSTRSTAIESFYIYNDSSI